MELNKNNIFTPILIYLFIILLSACEKDNGERTWTKIDGIYTCEESSPHAGYKKYIVEIDKVRGQENTYIITNFHNAGNLEFLFMNLQNDSLKIENQVIGSLFINGKGKISENFDQIEIEYTADDGQRELDFFAVYTR